MLEVVSDDEIHARLAELRGVPQGSSPALGVPSGAGEGDDSLPPLEYVRRAGEVTESLLSALRIEDGIGLGLLELDALTRGFRAGDLVLIVGYVHSGKTQLVNTMILNNPTKRVLFFSMDDPAEMILAKLVSMATNIRAGELERSVRDGDEYTIDMIRKTVHEGFENLIVVDDSVGILAMKRAVEEAREVWGADPDAVCIDYLGIIPGRADEEARAIPENAKALKVWARQNPWPTIVVHQGTRTNSPPGAPITLKSAAFGGDAQASVLLGVRRKSHNEELSDEERTMHENTTTLHLVKNKRPGGKLTHHSGMDFYIDPNTGMVRPLEEGDLHRTVRSTPSAAVIQQRAMEL